MLYHYCGGANNQHDIILELQRARNITITLLPNDKESEEELALKMSHCKLI